MKTWLKAYGAAWITIAALDAVWLGVLARGFYQAEMGTLMADEIRLPAALVFYVGYPAGLVTLALWPRPAALTKAALRAGLVGAMAYGTYDFSNRATLENWSLTLTLVDVTWGICVSAAAGVAAWFASRR